MDDRYVKLQAVIDDLIAERDRAIDEALELSWKLDEARREAEMQRNNLAALTKCKPCPLPWERDDDDC